MKLDILAIGIHPDDVELSCSGTLLSHIAMGNKVGILDMTHGELGTRGTPALRLQEAAEAAKIMGASIRETLDLKDGLFSNTTENKLKIIQVIRKYQPEIVLANAIEDRHPDHGRAAKMTSEACFLSGLLKIPTTDKEGIAQQHWRPKAVYHYIQDYTLQPNFVVDITGFIDRKMECIMAFKSQFYNPDSNELITPIATKDFLESVKAKNRVHGRFIGVEFGEGFNLPRPVGVNNLFHLI